MLFFLMYTWDLLYELVIDLNEDYKPEALEISSEKGDIVSEGNKSITVNYSQKVMKLRNDESSVLWKPSLLVCQAELRVYTSLWWCLSE